MAASTAKITPTSPQPKPPVAYSIPEAARAASIGTTKLRLEIRAKRLRARKLGKRSLITVPDLEAWAAALPDIRDVAPDTAAAGLKDFRVGTANSRATVAKRPAARDEVTET
jgi:hypothetical protein